MSSSSNKSIGILVDELKSEEILIRIEAYKKLKTIAIALGPDRSVKELLPFLTCSLNEEEDELLVILAQQLSPDFYRTLMGEKSANATALIMIMDLLENLAGAEESLVRNAAVENLKLFIEQVPDCLPLAKEMFLRLAAGEWYTTKVSAAAILQMLVKKLAVGDSIELINKVVSYLEDESPMVRRSAIPSLSTISSVLGKDLVEKCIKLASSDSQDSVRLLTMELLMVSGDLINVDPYVKQLAEDQSWRVRFMVATHLQKISRPQRYLFFKLLDDEEQEVRAATAGNLGSMATLLGYKPDFVLAIQRACNDPSVHVRSALALQLSLLGKAAGPIGIRKEILPLIETLMRDDSSQVRLNAVSRLDTLIEVIGIAELSDSLLSAIKTLGSDKQWRVRQAILGYFPVLAAHLGPSAEVTQLAVGWLVDPVYCVRRSAGKCLVSLCQSFGRDWMIGDLRLAFDALLHQSKPNYLKRVTIVETLKTIDPDAIYYGEFWDELKNDPISNVRMVIPEKLALPDSEEHEPEVIQVRKNPPILID